MHSQILAQLQAGLQTGELQPGSVYSAPALAERFGVSATPVREALRELVRDGAVEILPNSGYRVVELSQERLDNVVELRVLIEVPVMGAIAAACDATLAPQVEALRPLAQALNLAATEGDVIAYMDLDTRYHCDFLALHGNPEVVDTVRKLRQRSRLFGLLRDAQAGVLIDATTEHEDMVDLALAGDQPGMERLVREHILKAKRQRLRD
nr:GntR family transcriptional regulator [Lysinibacter cavernae]